MSIASNEISAKPKVNPKVMTQSATVGSRNTILALAGMMALMPVAGVPGELVLQDTLKSALLAFGVLVAATIFVWECRLENRALLWHGLLWLPLALCAYALGSMVWSHTYLAGVEAVRWALLGLLMWVGLNALSRANILILVWGIHVGAVAASTWTAAQFWGNLDWFPQVAAPASTFVNRNFFAEYAVCALPLSVLALVQLQTAHWRQLMALSIAFNIVALMMTGTRSALVAFLLTMPLMLFLLWRCRRQLAWNHWSKGSRISVLLVLLVGVLAMGAIPSHNPVVLQERAGSNALERSFLRTTSVIRPAEYTEGSFSVRAVMWKASARMVMDRPWTGVGAGAWEVQIPLYQSAGKSLETDYYAHNEYLQLLGEYGLPVGGLCLAFLFAYILQFSKALFRYPTTDSQTAVPLSLACCTSVSALAVVNNAGFPLHLATAGALLALCLAILARFDEHAPSAPGRSWPSGYFKVALVALSLAVAMATFVTVQAMRAENIIIQAIRLVRAQDVPRSSSPMNEAAWQDLFGESIAINPHNRKLISLVADPLSERGDWNHAVVVLEVIAASRPNIPQVWSNLAQGYAQLHRSAQAWHALEQFQRVQPDEMKTRELELLVLSGLGEYGRAVALLDTYFAQGSFSQSMTHTGYVIGYQTHNWPLAIRALELGNARWPAQSANGYFRLGKMYAEPALHDDANALIAFRKGLAAVPLEQRTNYKNQVPLPYREQI